MPDHTDTIRKTDALRKFLARAEGKREGKAGNEDDLVMQAYLYGYAPVTMWATDRIQTAVPNAHLFPGKAPINQFSYITALANPDETTVIRPNVDTIYTPAWLDLSGQPMVLRVPAVSHRYYVVPLLDAYSNQFASLGPRTTGTGGGDYLLASPRWSGRVPDSIAAVIHAPTPTVWILARTLVRGPDDLEAAVAILSQYQLVPLSEYGTIYTPPEDVHFRPPEPDFVPPTGLPVTAAPGFESSEFFRVMSPFLRRNPPPRDEWALLASFAPVVARRDVPTPDILNAAKAAMDAAIAAAGTLVNHWGFSLQIGNYGKNYPLRAAIAASGLGGIIKEDAVYANCSMDADDHSLNGSNGNSYTIHFPPELTPPVNGFWSITAYNEHILLAKNSIERYAVGSETGLIPNQDSSLTIYLGNAGPASEIPQQNWLPVPNGPFSLTLRMYWPKAAVLSGEYEIPPVRVYE